MSEELRGLGYTVKSLAYIDEAVIYGTGFFISESGLFLTNYHVIEKAGTISLRKPDGRILDAVVLVDDRENDIAILAPLHNTQVENWLSLGNTAIENIGERIKVVGYPYPKLRKDPTLSVGVIASSSGFIGEAAKFQISAPIQLGNSGSPILNQKNEVVGIVNERLEGMVCLHDTGPLPADLGIGIKAEYAKPLLERCAAKDRLSAANRPVSLSKAMDATALVLVNFNKLPASIQMPEEGVLVLIEFSKLIGFDLIYYTVINLNNNWTEQVTAEMKFTGSIAGAPSSTTSEIARVAIDEILKKIGQTGP